MHNPHSPWCLDQVLAPRPRLPPEERVRPGESALARWAMTCSDGGRFSGETASAGSVAGLIPGLSDAGLCRAGDLGSFFGVALVGTGACS